MSLRFLPLFLLIALNIPVVSADSEPASKLVSGAIPTAPHEVSSQLCGSCHKEIYAEWEGTMHATSTPLTDPIHGAMYRKVIGDPTKEGVKSGKGKYPVCLKCHVPNAAIQKKTKVDSQEAFNEGVNCIVCHTIKSFKGITKANGKLQLGVSAYEISKTSLQAPSGKNYSTSPQVENGSAISKPFHPYPMEGGNSALFQSSDMCMGCHDKRNNSHGIAVCATGDEIRMSESDVSCQSCHMPVVNGRVSHVMVGGHDSRMVRRGVALGLELEKSAGVIQANVTMKNLLPHKFPTGAPFRNVYLELTAFDVDGKELWKNFETHPLKDDKKAVLLYVLGDGKGKPTGAPGAKEVLSDSRLEPHASKTLKYGIPEKDVVTVRAELMYNLILPNMAKMLEPVADKNLISPKSVALAEAEVSVK